jgi:hypothetical protein
MNTNRVALLERRRDISQETVREYSVCLTGCDAVLYTQYRVDEVHLQTGVVVRGRDNICLQHENR